MPVVPVRGYMGEGLLSIPEYLTKKILQLELVKMQELMPETWLRDKEENMSNMLFLPWRRTAPPPMALVLWCLITEITPNGAGTDGISSYDRQVQPRL